VKLDSTVVGKALDLAYGKAVEGVPGVPGMESAEGLAQDYLNDGGSLENRVNALIRYQVVKASTSGFVTGLGGILTLPIAIPANLASIMYLQLQMVAAIAHMGGHDVRSDRVRSVCYACLCGNAATDVLKGAGITIGRKLTEQAIKQLSYDVILKINQRVGFRLLTKFGQTGAINLGKGIPLVGGIIGGTFDGTTTYAIGRVARGIFVAGDEVGEERAKEADAVVDLSGEAFDEEKRDGGWDAFFGGEDEDETPTKTEERGWWSRW